jgi:ABC-type dipeptide/oligopeptide/nickel transport system permease component
LITYIIRRVLVSIPVLWGVLTLVFISIHLIPGDPAQVMLFGRGHPADVAALRHQLGLDRPLPVQYWSFITHAVHLDFGTSIISHQPVMQEIWDRFPYTAELAVSAMILATIFGVITGIYSATHNRRLSGTVVTGFAVLGISVPDFWLGTMLAVIFGVNLHWLPVAGTGGVANIILPAVTLATVITATLTRLVRSSMVDVLGREYVRTAHAKGLRRLAVVYKHVMRNALIPVVTVFGLTLGGLLGGAVILENVFAWPGLGTLAVSAVTNRDFPVVQGTTFFFAVILIGANLLVDISYAFLDPRIHYS